jgi:hypothetical protein
MLQLLYPRERSITHSTGGWVRLGVDLDHTENLTLTSIQSHAVQPTLLYSHMLVYQLLRGAYCLYLQGRRVEVSVCSAFKIRSFHSSMLKI